MDQQPQQLETDRRVHRRRVAVFLVLAFALAAWGPRAITVITDGWCSSRQALEQERQIRAAEQRIEILERRVAYARTAEGRDVEAKRRFGVGPDDEVWITVEAERPPRVRPEPQSVADRLHRWLTNVGSRFVDRIRTFGAVIGYWIGVEEVDACVVVPEIDDSGTAGGEDASNLTGEPAGPDSEASDHDTGP